MLRDKCVKFENSLHYYGNLQADSKQLLYAEIQLWSWGKVILELFELWKEFLVFLQGKKPICFHLLKPMN